MDNDTVLFELNREETRRLIPAILCLAVIGVIGLIGNILSLHIYLNYYTRSNSRSFFIYLSAIEIFACLCLVPFEIIILTRQFIFKSGTFCRCYMFIVCLQVMMSADILIVIAVDRWRKICHPFGWQLSYRASKYLCMATVPVAAVEAFPLLWLFGLHHVYIRDYNITGRECSMSDGARATVFPFLYNIFFWLITIVRISILSILYLKILEAVKRSSEKFRRKTCANKQPQKGNEMYDRVKDNVNSKKEMEMLEGLSQTNTNSVETNQTTSTSSDAMLIRGAHLNPVKHTLRDVGGNTPQDSEKTSVDQSKSADHDVNRPISPSIFHKNEAQKIGSNRTSSKRSSKNSQSNQRSRHVTVVMFAVTVSCVLLYLPTLVLGTLRGVIPNFEGTLSHSERSVFKFFVRFYFMKSLFNPVIYGVLDTRFRSAAKSIIRKRFR